MRTRIGLFILLCGILLPFTGDAQDGKRPSWPIRYANSLINDTSDISKPQFMVYPTVAFAPETSWEFGFSTLLVYYANQDTTNRLSEVSGFTFVTLESQWGIWFDHALYSDQDKWFLLGRIRFQNFPLRYYGIGMDTPPRHQALVDANQILIKERLLRKVGNNLFFGLEADYQRLSNVSFLEGPAFDDLTLPRGAEGSDNIGFGLGLLYDNRHNVLNVRDGALAELAVLHYHSSISTFGFTSVISDNRLFKTVARNTVLAGQLLGQFNFGDVPFNQLALMGGENMMRGYYVGRFRDRHQVAAQGEIRFLPLPLGFSKRIGAAAFGGVATVFDDFGRATGGDLVWSAGAGLRFLIFPKKDIYTRFDVALTAEGTGYYLFIGEAF
ncbi:MAG: outer membrane protein assembly factor [Flavobacteriales bacterium]|nr:outer membrane protein assembly factor [Flavobacteriales bacterium]